jgi:preprotein translocase SecE subunit
MSTQESAEALETTTGKGGGDGKDVAVAEGSNEGFFGRISKFWRDVRGEMGRVSWPSLDDVKKTTVITLIAVIFFALYLFLADRAIVLLGRFGLWLLTQIGLA